MTWITQYKIYYKNREVKLDEGTTNQPKVWRVYERKGMLSKMNDGLTLVATI